MSGLDDAIDELYRGDLAGFITARNALAKARQQPELRALEKPSVPAWAVNQLYWTHREQFDAVVAAALAVRDAHAHALSGRAADIRGAETAHREAIRHAVTMCRELLAAAGQPPSSATLDAVTRTCEALPSSGAQGRLVRPLSPAGLEALAGLAVAEARPMRVVASPLRSASAAAAHTDAEGDARVEREAARRMEAARERDARLAAAKRDVVEAELAFDATRAAVEEAERVVARCQAARDDALAVLRRVRRVLDAI